MSEETKSTSPINFDPSTRPRRQDYKVYFQDFLFAHTRHYLIYVHYRVILLKMECSTSVEGIYWNQDSSRVENVALLKYHKSIQQKLIHLLILHLQSRFCLKNIYNCSCDNVLISDCFNLCILHLISFQCPIYI